ncbi:dihydroxyacetone kinase family protein [Streptomyces jeddahensis]|uniref:PTS-dependent dihydroxyacetone kinase, dihydroxyacetone-binding subunit DhaK n=1 Tax=Streptomyces jeddahensis TaxID=1716141 RepID=A0A177HHH9_9ACTN|nr:dihydroxyacetone kinase family protein [Streptomyces jeddahensis]OAH10166.1 PTS-dependent dihydroxyacetone kinase, dihydroxyacetone-binding subunit DhaK [Streptomyces jeddahensis]
MTRLFADPSRFSEDQLRGFAAAYSEHVTRVPGGVVRTRPLRPGQVAVVVGGGSGHYPAFSGLVGSGLAAGAVVGNIFTSPSSRQAESVARAADAGGGVLYCFGNYAGDRMNFGMAQARLRDAGIDTRTVLVTDDVASAPAERSGERRGIAGDFTVFKVAGAAAEEGLGLDAVEAAARHANAATYSFGIAFAGCTMPGADAPLFTVPDGKMAIGLGIHGEPGVEDADMADAPAIARILVDRLLAERPATAGTRVAAILNGLGATKYEELFLLWGHVAEALAAAGLTVVRPEVGELVTSLDMAACSLTLMWLDEDLERWWCAPADAPGFRRLPLPEAPAQPRALPEAVLEAQVAAGDESSRGAAATVLAALRALQAALHDAAAELGRIDAVAGDGDHGRGMTKGVDAAVRAAERAGSRGAGARSLLSAAADAWADEAGGTSGVLWGVGLRALAQELGDTGPVDGVRVAAGARAALDAVTSLGGAKPGDKTLVDALAPLVDAFTAGVGRREDPVAAFELASAEASAAAESTAALTPRLGRARPLAERSVGTPDAGALSLALCARTVAGLFAK